jgi:hypothetical protein
VSIVTSSSTSVQQTDAADKDIAFALELRRALLMIASALCKRYGTQFWRVLLTGKAE